MATKTINAELLAKMFLAGAANLEAKKEFINELNPKFRVRYKYPPVFRSAGYIPDS